MLNPAEPSVRRTQEERSATTRAKLIDAAIDCLHRMGYSATSTTVVASTAGVSRGAMVHQFPAKADLMLAVLRAVYEQDGELHRRSIAISSPRQWLSELPQTMWAVISRPAGIAVMEIMLASRSDPELADKLRAIQQQIDREAHPWVVDQLHAAGIEDHPEGDAIHHLFVAAVRGLALEQLFRKSPELAERSVAILTLALHRFYPQLDTPT